MVTARVAGLVADWWVRRESGLRARHPCRDFAAVLPATRGLIAAPWTPASIILLLVEEDRPEQRLSSTSPGFYRPLKRYRKTTGRCSAAASCWLGNIANAAASRSDRRPGNPAAQPTNQRNFSAGASRLGIHRRHRSPERGGSGSTAISFLQQGSSDSRAVDRPRITRGAARATPFLVNAHGLVEKLGHEDTKRGIYLDHGRYLERAVDRD